MSSVNKAIIVGRLTKAPVSRNSQSGKKIVAMTVATSEVWKDKRTGERKEKSEFHNVVIFSEGLANVAEQYLKKGSQVYLEGQIVTRDWTDNNGVKKYITEIVLQGFNSSLQLLDSKPANEQSSVSNKYDDMNDEIGF